MNTKNRIPPTQADWQCVHPNPEKVVCRDCIYRQRDREEHKELLLKYPHLSGFCNGVCEKYPDYKPDDILFENAICPYYKKEN